MKGPVRASSSGLRETVVRAESPQAVTFADFAAFVIAAAFVTAVFVAPFICAWHYLDAHIPPYNPTTTSTPRKAGATFRSEDCHRKDSETAHASGDSEPKKAVTRHLSVMSVGSLQGDFTDTQVPDDGQRDRTRTGSANAAKCVTDRRDGRLAREPSGALGETSMAHAQGVRSVPSPVVGRSLLKPAAGSSLEHSLRVSARVGDPSRLGLFALKMGREGRGASAQGLRALATSAAHLCGVPVAIFHALIQRESSWRPWVVSSSGAVGLGQIKPSTLRDIDPRLNAWAPWDNLLGSACYLRQQFDRFGTWRKALHAYHAGPNRKTTRRATHDYASDIMGAN